MRSDITDSFIAEQRKKTFPYKETFLDFTIRVDKDVYPPCEDSKVLANILLSKDYPVFPGMKALDFGTGTGLFSLVLAKGGADVIATDINSAAVKCARYNADHNGLGNKIEVRLGESFEAIRNNELFDVVVTSLPFESASPEDEFETSVYDENFNTRRKFFQMIKNHLKPNGCIFFTYADYAEAVAPISDFLHGYDYQLISEVRSADNELNRVYLIKKL